MSSPNPHDARPTSDTMDETTFRRLAHDVIERVRQALDAEDPDVVEAVIEAEVLKVTFPHGTPFVLNLQRPVREMWLAADRQAWHFRFNGEQWLDKKSGAELFSTLSAQVSNRTKTAINV